MKKRILSILLTAAMMLTLFAGVPITASAESEGIWEYEIENGEATLTGCTEPVGDLTIPDSLGGYPVTEIGYMTFSGCNSLTSITIPNSVTSIVAYAFSGCDSLTSITIPDSVRIIGDNAFASCDSLTSVTVSDGVMSIGVEAFARCENLTSITLSDSVTSIGEDAFSGCTGLTSITVGIGNQYYSSIDGILYNKDKTELIICPEGKAGSVTIPDSITRIGNGAFCDCTLLTSVTITDNVTQIGDSAFSGCTGLTSIAIPDSVTSIGDCAFQDCTNLTSITIPDSVTSIGGYAFDNTGYYNNEANWEDSVLYLDKHLIDVNSDISGAYSIKDGTKTIAGSAFYSCTSLTSITIPDSVTEIGGGAFQDCTNLTSITIPDNVTSIGSYAFDNTGYYNDMTNWENGALYIGKHLIKVSTEYVGEYVVKDGTKTIAGSAFKRCDNLTSITIPESVLGITDHAILDCHALTNIDVDKNNANYYSVGGVLFDKTNHVLLQYPDAKKDTLYTIPDGVTSVADYALSECDNLTSVIIPDSVTNIGSCAFEKCASLTSVTIPNGVSSIGDWAFSSCGALTSVTIPNSVMSIETFAFYNCLQLTFYGYTGSYAETYASKYGVPFVALEKEEIIGDLDGSEAVDVGDIMKIKDLIMKENWTDDLLKLGDLNNSGSLDVGDIMALKNLIMGS